MEEIPLSNYQHERVPWPEELKDADCPVILPKSFIEILGHNDPISIEQSRVVHEFKGAQLKHIEANMAQIEQLTREIKRLKQSNASLKKHTFACDVILSPFRRLTTDILYQINSHFPPIDHSKLCTIMSHCSSTASQISKSWRQTLHGISSLWANMHIDCSNWDSKPLQPLIERVEHYSRLSGLQPLTVQLDDQSAITMFNRETNGLLRLLEWIFNNWSCRHRLFRLCIRPRFDLKSSFHEYAKAGLTLPSVQSYMFLHYAYCPPPSRNATDSDESDLAMLSRIFPNLNRLWLTQGNLLLNTVSFNPVPFPNIADLKSIYLHQCLAHRDFHFLLAACPNLEVAWFSLEVSNLPHIAQSLPIIHHHLKYLTCEVESLDGHILYPFAGFTFPCLDKLHLDLPEFEVNAMGETVDDRMDIFPSLKTLIITGDLEDNESVLMITQLLPIFPTISHFEIHNLNSVIKLATVFNAIQGMYHSRLLFPQLQSMSVGIDVDGADDELFCRQLETILMQLFSSEPRSSQSSSSDDLYLAGLTPISHPKKCSLTSLRILFEFVGYECFLMGHNDDSYLNAWTSKMKDKLLALGSRPSDIALHVVPPADVTYIRNYALMRSNKALMQQHFQMAVLANSTTDLQLYQ